MTVFKVCGYCFSPIKKGEVCGGCINKLISEVSYLKKENKLLFRFIDMLLEAEGLEIDRPNGFMDNFMGNDISDSTLRIRRITNRRI